MRYFNNINHKIRVCCGVLIKKWKARHEEYRPLVGDDGGRDMLHVRYMEDNVSLD